MIEEIKLRYEITITTRESKLVATLNPELKVAHTCAELATRWSVLEKLPADEASAFADDIESSRASLPPVKTSGD